MTCGVDQPPQDVLSFSIVFWHFTMQIPYKNHFIDIKPVSLMLFILMLPLRLKISVENVFILNPLKHAGRLGCYSLIVRLFGVSVDTGDSFSFKG